ncbi:GIY-YIG nuclease family protein [Candidatus Dojkabacteria bacterium]|uniref:GIY-YIG nuclease family protein n=1 Tax=Candidatus Dojkabacteria bacterium TaxID=2099670 RepID=A0A955L8W3_9BACT|nr:GIY-YIG nuclease family protein [Candidatus Dojkabacteria bacterium]
MGKKYVGSTNNLVRRLKEHNSGRTKHGTTLISGIIIY